MAWPAGYSATGTSTASGAHAPAAGSLHCWERMCLTRPVVEHKGRIDLPTETFLPISAASPDGSIRALLQLLLNTHSAILERVFWLARATSPPTLASPEYSRSRS